MSARDRAAARSAGMQALAGALAAAVTPAEVAAAMVDEGLRAAGAPIGGVALLGADGATFELVAGVGHEDAAVAAWRRFPNAGAIPAVEAVARRAGVYVERHATLAARYPAAAALAAASGVRAVAVLPLLVTQREVPHVLGCVAFEFREERRFPAAERRFLETLVQQCAQAMHRALSNAAAYAGRGDPGPERERLALVLERLPVGVVLVGASGEILQHNSAAEVVLGHPVHRTRDMAGYARYGGVHPDGRPFAPEEYPVARVLRHGTAVQQEHTHYVTAGGARRVLSISAAPVRGPDGATRYAVAVLQDVTALHAAQQALRESEARFRQLTEQLPLGVYESDAAGRMVYCNPRLVAIAGRGERDVLAGRWLHDVHADDRAPLEAERARLRAAGAATARLAFRIVHPRTGVVRHLVVETAALRDADGARRGSVGVVEDVTEQRALQAQLQQAQKMEAVGRLAGGVAHDFNNLLTVISASTQFLLDDTPPADPRHADVVQIRDVAARAAELTRQLLAFSRQHVVRPRPFDLNALAGQADKLLRRLLGADVALTLDLDPALPHALGDPGQVEQALMNLVLNARDAMPEGGRLVLATALATLDADYAAAHPDARAGRYAVLAVSDTGTGMDAETCARAFEPFFTTKPPGTGTGLGLSMVYGLARQMGGHVAVYSEPGLGSTFRFYVPLAEPGAAGPPPEPPLAGDGRGRETVLVVEDDEHVRETVRRTLAARGYTVLEAASGEAALRVAREHPGDVALLLTDVVMPGLGGRAVADAVAALRPGVAVAFMSGYAGDPALRARLAEGAPFLEKPFTVAQLAGLVRRVLDARAAGAAPGAAATA